MPSSSSKILQIALLIVGLLTVALLISVLVLVALTYTNVENLQVAPTNATSRRTLPTLTTSQPPTSQPPTSPTTTVSTSPTTSSTSTTTSTSSTKSTRTKPTTSTTTTSTTTTTPNKPPTTTTTRTTRTTSKKPTTPTSTSTTTTTPMKPPTSTSSASTTTTSKQFSTSTIATYMQNYDGTMNTDETWNPDLCDKDSEGYKFDADKYAHLISNSLQTSFPGSLAVVNDLQSSTGSCQTFATKKSRTVRKSQDDTVVVDFSVQVAVPVGDPAPSAKIVQLDINSNINCTGCSISTATTTMEPTTHTIKTRTTTESHKGHRSPAQVASDYIRLNMDDTVRPCDDFYKFSCGNFKKHHNIPSDTLGYGTFDLVQDRIVNEIDLSLRKINLTADPDIPDWLRKTKQFYDNCMLLANNGNRDNKELLKIIDSFGGWPMIMKKGTWDEKKFNLAEVLATLTATYGVQTIITAYVDVDWKHPDIFIPQIDQATLALGNPVYYSHVKYEDDRRDYVKSIRETASVLLCDQDMPQDDDRIDRDSEDIMLFERDISKHVKTDDQRKSYVEMYDPEIISSINTAYNFMDWNRYFDLLLPSNVDHPYDGIVNVVEQSYMIYLTKYLNATNKETVANYLIWRLIDSLNMFMDDRLMDTGRRLVPKSNNYKVKSSGLMMPRKRRDCTSYVINELAFAGTRLLLANNNEHSDTFNIEPVRNMTARLMDSFKLQLDRLFWMDNQTRNEAKKKLDNYVEVIEYPSWIFREDKMDDYYDSFKIFALRDRFLEDYISLTKFNEEVNFRLIGNKNVTRKDFPRTIWSLSPAIVNAWYQPEFNSITFPSGILRPPFFKYDFPWAVNFGALGAIVGHEMTHGFDDQGVQFNGTGYLKNWMTPESKLGFDKMVDCVIKEYDHTCFPQVDMCIDGDQTQGENTADNGGIRVAYDSYLKYIAEFGPEDSLPGLEDYTMEQIFFISFANVWCGDYLTPEYLEDQLVTNVHSPPPARVYNTLRNFADFGRAFECEIGQTYYPFRSEVCYVWDSPPVSDNPVFNRSAERLLENMDQRTDPCNDFYTYACGNFTRVHKAPAHALTYTSFDILQEEIYLEIIEKLDKTGSGTTTAIEKAKTYFDVCSNANKTEKEDDKEILGTLSEVLRGYPAIDSLWKAPKNPETFYAQLIGNLASSYGIQTLLVASSQVCPDDPGYNILALDQSSLSLGAREYYIEEKLTDVLNNYTSLIANVTYILAHESGDTGYTYQSALFAGQAITDFEKGLAERIRPNRDRNNYTALNNQFTVGFLKQTATNFDFNAYLMSLVQYSDALVQYMSDNNSQVIVSEPNFFKGLGKFVINQLNSDNTILSNYLCWRFIFARLNFMSADVKEQYANFKKIKDGVTTFPPAKMDCVDQLATMLGYTVGRLYVDDWKTRDWRNDTSETIISIVTTYDDVIPQLNYMDKHSQQGAKTKINQLLSNVGFPDWILNDKLLNEYYENYTIEENATYFDAFNNLNAFAITKSLEAIVERVNGKDFQMSPVIVNAWYSLTMNSLTIPAAILNPPYYNPDFPTPLKYGAIGVIMGHEMTHAFDESGMQFDGQGGLDLWMTRYSRDAYDRNVIDCVENQYEHYCHTINGEQYCGNGQKTQLENVADNGGIRQAFRAYRNVIREKVHETGHEELLLPGMEWFNEDQIFFLGAAQSWCGYYSDLYIRRQLIVDVHSPGPDRVKGMVSNFPEFDRAFHCNIGDPMNPKEKCYVWANPTDTTDGYDKSAKALLDSIDVTTDPCDDFYQYACGNWIGKHPILKGESTRSTNSEATNLAILKTTNGIQNVNENDTNTPAALVKTKQMFDFCASQIHNTDSTSFMLFTKFMDKDLKGWPVLTPFWNEDITSVFEVLGTLGSLDEACIFTAYPQPDYGFLDKDGAPFQYALFIDQGQLLLGNREVYLNPMFDYIIDIYRGVLIYTITELSEKMDDDNRPTILTIHDDVDDIINFEKNLARISLPESLLENYTLQYNSYEYQDLSEEFPNIKWEVYLKNLLPEELLANKFKTEAANVILSEPTFVKALNDLLPFVSPRTIQNYIIWRYVVSTSAYIGDNMKMVHQEIHRQLGHLGSLNDMGEFKGYASLCTKDIINYLPWTAGRLFAEQQFGGEILKVQHAANDTIHEVIRQFKQRLDTLNRYGWLDDKSHENLVEKLDKLRVNVGYPDWIFIDSHINFFYKTIPIDPAKFTDYFTLRTEVIRWFIQGRFHALNESFDVHRDYFQTSPSVQNAWYNPWLNSLTIPAAELQAPFYQPDYPTAVNFGGLAAIAGHELTHGFDNEGIQVNGYGGMSDPPLMDAQSSAYFSANISQCVIDQYSSYCYNDLPSGKLCINGKATQGENIADNGGTKTAFNAYLEWVRAHGYEASLPGLEKYSMNQIFFLNFAQSWCTNITPEALEKQLLLDMHSPARNRVIGTLSNMVEFQAAFKCKKGDAMVPENRCDVW